MIPGNPAAVETAADELRHRADDLVEVRDTVTAQARGLHSAWEGMAELRATVQIENQAGKILEVADAARGAGPVLRTYAAELRTAQQQFADGQAEAARGQGRIDGVGSAASAAADATRQQGHQEVLAGQGAMAAALERVRVANETAAGQIDRLTGELAQALPEHPPPPASDEPGLFSTIGHGILDVGGLVPGAGELLDLGNAAWYEAEGNHVDAGLSAAGAIPFAGWFATGGKAIRHGARGADSARGARPDSRTLGRNLEAAGTTRPPGTHAHHIVAGNSPRARAAQDALERHGIDINDPANGVFLPGNARSPNPTGASVHAPLHTKDYFDEVNRTLGSARNREEALDALDYLRSELEAGKFPR